MGFQLPTSTGERRISERTINQQNVFFCSIWGTFIHDGPNRRRAANLSVSDGPGFGSEEFGRWADLGVREL